MGTSADLKVGQSVYAIGTPLGFSRTLTVGVVSGLDRAIPSPAGTITRGAIQARHRSFRPETYTLNPSTLRRNVGEPQRPKQQAWKLLTAYGARYCCFSSTKLFRRTTHQAKGTSLPIVKELISLL